jgi:hypothetical protein
MLKHESNLLQQNLELEEGWKVKQQEKQEKEKD